MRTLLHVCQPTTEGVAVVVGELTQAGLRAGYRVIVACPAGGDLAQWLQGTGAQWRELPMAREPRLSDLRALLALRRVMAEADVVHLHSSKAGALGRLAAMAMRRPPRVVFTPHGWSWLAVQGYRRQVFRVVERALASRADAISVVSEAELRDGRAVLGTGARFNLIENWVDTDRFTPDGPAAPRESGRLLLQVGRLCHQKGQDRSIRALAGLKDSGTRLRLLGDGPDRAGLVSLAADLGVADRVEFMGTTDPVPHMRAADVLLLPSRWEGMALVLLEAMSIGLPVISSACGGSDALAMAGQVIPDGSEDDFIAALGRAVDRLPVDGMARAGIGRALVLTWHSARRAVDRYEALWAEESDEPATRRIAMVINSLQMGGAETQFLRVARALRRAGYDVKVFALLDDNDFPGEEVTVLAPRPGPMTVLNAVRQFRTWKPDVVLNFLYQATLVGRVAARCARVPVVISSMRNERLESRLRTRLFRVTGFLDAVTVTNSQRAAQTLTAERTVHPSRLQVIPNGVDLSLLEDARTIRKPLGVSDDDFLFLGVGRLTAQKDWSTLIGAVELYRGPPARWIIAGDGPGDWDMRATIAARGLGDKITLLGLRNDIPDLLESCDALVLCSIYEGLPNVVLEAMAMGRPVVATRVGGVPELLEPSFGTIVEPRHPAQLASAMAELATRSRADLSTMGTLAGAKIRSHYTLEAADQRWTTLVGGLMAMTGVDSSGRHRQWEGTRGDHGSTDR